MNAPEHSWKGMTETDLIPVFQGKDTDLPPLALGTAVHININGFHLIVSHFMADTPQRKL